MMMKNVQNTVLEGTFMCAPSFLVCRGVQYVHWVMHKCIMVKVEGERNTRKGM